MLQKATLSAVLFASLLLVFGREQVATAAPMTFHVNSAADPGAGICDVAECTLREAITAANANPGHDTIDFEDTVFLPGVYINVASELPYIDASQGITMDGTLPGTLPDDHVFIDGSATSNAYGLVFLSSLGQDIEDVIVRNVYVQYFDQNGIQFCPGFDNINFVCSNDTDGVVLDGVVLSVNGAEGIKFLGRDASNVTMNRVDSGFNSGDGVAFIVDRNITGIHDTDGSYIVNGRYGLYFEAEPSDISDVTLTRTRSGGNLGDGIHFYALNISNVRATDLLLDDNEAKGISLEANGETSDVEIKDIIPSSNPSGGVVVVSDIATNIRVLNNNLQAVDDTAIRFSFNTGTGIRIGNNQVANSIYGIFVRGGTIDVLTVDGNIVTDSVSTGIKIASDQGGGPRTISNASVEDNDVLGSAGIGIAMQAQSLTAAITGNLVDESGHTGIYLERLAAGDNRVTVSGNTITRGGERGIWVNGLAGVISRNSFSANALIGIDVRLAGDPANGLTLNDPGDTDSQGENTVLNFPVITANVDHTVSGTTCADCLVELFIADGDPTDHGEGATFIGDATADSSGNFTISLCGHALASGTEVTATATGGSDDNPLAPFNTSEFSENFEIEAFDGNCGPTGSPTATPAPSETVWGDLDCDGDVTPLDALLPLLWLEDLPFEHEPPCPDLNEEIGDFQFADVNCDGVIDEQDAVAILAYSADVPIERASGCPAIGQSL